MNSSPAGAEGVGDRLGVWRRRNRCTRSRRCIADTGDLPRTCVPVFSVRHTLCYFRFRCSRPTVPPPAKHRFLGNFTTWGRHQSILDIPGDRSQGRRRPERRRRGRRFVCGAIDHRTVAELLVPLVELFWLSAADLARRSEEMLDAVDSRSLRWSVRATPGAYRLGAGVPTAGQGIRRRHG